MRGFGFKTIVNQMVIGIWKCDYESGFGNMVNKILKWLLDFGNVIMKVENLGFKWF